MLIKVTVKPHSGKNEIVKDQQNGFIVFTTVAPEKGKANKAVLRLIARHFKLPVSALNIVLGHNSRRKIIALD